jgi:hypothetical protein
VQGLPMRGIGKRAANDVASVSRTSGKEDSSSRHCVQRCFLQQHVESGRRKKSRGWYENLNYGEKQLIVCVDSQCPLPRIWTAAYVQLEITKNEHFVFARRKSPMKKLCEWMEKCSAWRHNTIWFPLPQLSTMHFQIQQCWRMWLCRLPHRLVALLYKEQHFNQQHLYWVIYWSAWGLTNGKTSYSGLPSCCVQCYLTSLLRLLIGRRLHSRQRGLVPR